MEDEDPLSGENMFPKKTYTEQEVENVVGRMFSNSIEFQKPKYEQDSFESFFEKKKEEKLIEKEPFEEGNTPESILWEDLDQKVFEEQSWRIKNLIPKQGFVILASISGNRKTWLAMEMAKTIASGKDFLGEEIFKTEGANVLYLNGENSESEMQRRGRQLNFGPSIGPHKLHLSNTDNINLNKDEGALWLKSFIEFHKINVVFVDTFIAVAGGLKEDKSDEVRQFFNKFNSLKNTGVAVVWLMHMRKPTNFEGKIPKKEQLLGSQDKTASVEVLLMLYSEVGSEEINVYQRKNRLAVEIQPFKIGMKDVFNSDGKKTTVLDYQGEIEEQEGKKEQAKEMIMEILESEGKTTNQILEISRKQVGTKNTRQALADLVHDKIIQVTKQGKQNHYSLPKEKEKTDLIEPAFDFFQ